MPLLHAFAFINSVADKILDKSGLMNDGALLVDLALGIEKPLLKLNNLANDRNIAEQGGLSNLIKGMLSMFKLTASNHPEIVCHIDEQNAGFIYISFIHPSSVG